MIGSKVITCPKMKDNEFRYVKPKFEERKELAFPKDIWDEFNGGRFCIQCSGCHGCK